MTREEAETFLYMEARLLDENRLDEWSELMTDDVEYWIPLGGGTEDPGMSLSILYDDIISHRGRVWRISKSGLNNSQDPPSRTTRFVCNVEIENVQPLPSDSGADSEATVRCNSLIYEYRSGMQTRLNSPSHYATRCEYGLRVLRKDIKICRKKILILNRDGPLEPLTFAL